MWIMKKYNKLFYPSPKTKNQTNKYPRSRTKTQLVGNTNALHIHASLKVERSPQ